MITLLIASRYCLKIVVSKICSYCRYGALKKTVCASGAPTVVTFFFDSNNFLISICSMQQNVRSIFVGKLILPSSQKYFSDTLYTDLLYHQGYHPGFFLIIIIMTFSITIFRNNYCFFCYTKDIFQSFLEHFLANALALYQSI